MNLFNCSDDHQPVTVRHWRANDDPRQAKTSNAHYEGDVTVSATNEPYCHHNEEIVNEIDQFYRIKAARFSELKTVKADGGKTQL